MHAGIRVIEYTNRGKQALKNFRTIKKKSYKQFPDLILGLGTVMDTKTAGKGIQNGADFLVSPGYTKELSKFADNKNMLWIPGCITPTELCVLIRMMVCNCKVISCKHRRSRVCQFRKRSFPGFFIYANGGCKQRKYGILVQGRCFCSRYGQQSDQQEISGT